MSVDPFCEFSHRLELWLRFDIRSDESVIPGSVGAGLVGFEHGPTTFIGA